GCALHHVRGAVVGDEHEPGADGGLRASGRDVFRSLGLLHRAGVGNAPCGGSLRPHGGATHRPLREVPPREQRAMHLPLPLRRAEVVHVSTNHYDVVIIGSGAGGGTLFFKLATAGKKVLLIERGGYVPREKANWDPKAVNVEARYNTTEQWSDSDG